MGLHGLLTAFQSLPEKGFPGQQLSAHAEPLRTLAWKDEHQSWLALCTFPAYRHAGSGFIVQESGQALPHIYFGLAGQGQAVLVMAAPHPGIIAQTPQRDIL